MTGALSAGSSVRSGRGFTLIELLVVIAIIALLVGLILPSFGRARAVSRMSVSLNNCRQIMIATASYRHEQKDLMPMRMSYNAGGGWGGICTWSYGGKNTDSRSPDDVPAYWSTAYGGVFDEAAYTRPLNAYAHPEIVIDQPVGYQGWSGSGNSLSLRRGTVSVNDRRNLQMPIFRSPGDRSTAQRNWPGRDARVSSYDDVGTSYHMNLRWLFALSGGNFVTWPAFNEGMRRMRLVESFDSRFVWVHDQTADVVANADWQLPANQRRDWMGEFGDKNRSVMAFIDGRAEYVLMKPGELRTDKYNFLFQP
jgi:prepilin-type N-terminal cleavage/methylation domain-containing protein